MILRQTQTGMGTIRGRRPGFSLLEVLAALAIFLISMIALGELISITGERALQVQQLSRASQFSQSKLAEVVSGAISLSSQSGDFDEDPDWHWQVEADQDSSITGLWRIQVKVSRDMGDGTTLESTVNQMVLDPSMRGNTADAASSATSSDSSGGAGGSGSSGGGSTSGSGGGGGMAATGGGVMAGAGGATGAAPRTATPSNVRPAATTTQSRATGSQ